MNAQEHPSVTVSYSIFAEQKSRLDDLLQDYHRTKMSMRTIVRAGKTTSHFARLEDLDAIAADLAIEIADILTRRHITDAETALRDLLFGDDEEATT